MKNKALSIIFAILISISTAGCTTKPKLDQPPSILVTINDQVIDTVVGLDKWGGLAYDRPDTFDTIFRGDLLKYPMSD